MQFLRILFVCFFCLISATLSSELQGEIDSLYNKTDLAKVPLEQLNRLARFNESRKSTRAHEVGFWRALRESGTRKDAQHPRIALLKQQAPPTRDQARGARGQARETRVRATDDFWASNYWTQRDKERVHGSAISQKVTPFFNGDEFFATFFNFPCPQLLMVDEEFPTKTERMRWEQYDSFDTQIVLYLPFYRRNYSYTTEQLTGIFVLFHDLCLPAQKYLLACFENGTFDHQWLRVFMEMGINFGKLEPRELLAICDLILKDPLDTIGIPDWVPHASSKRTRSLIYLEYMKLRSTYWDSLPMRRTVLGLFKAMGWDFGNNPEVHQNPTEADCQIYMVERALCHFHNLRYFLNRFVQDGVSQANLYLLLKHAILRHPEAVEALGVFGRELSRYPVAARKSLSLLRHLTFVASKEPAGDGKNPETMDYFYGNQYPWLSLILPMIECLGYRFEVLDWEDQTVDWASRKCVFIGPVWGYSKKGNAFQEWLIKIKNYGVHTVNSMEFLSWNVYKTYLSDLQDAGISVVPTHIQQSTEGANLESLLQIAGDNWKTKDVIFKGVVGAGGFDYSHFNPSEPVEAQKHLETLLRDNNGIVMQPFWPEIGQMGEFSFVFVGNALSHVYLKVCGGGQERVQVFYGGRSFHYTPDEAKRVDDNSILKAISAFRPDALVQREALELVFFKAQILWTNIQQYMLKRNMCPPPVVRLDCVLRRNKLFVMEIEGLDPYLEFMEAGQRYEAAKLIKNYVAELLRQFSIYG